MCYPSQRWQLPHRLWDFILGASTSVILHKTQEASGTQIVNSPQQGKMAGCYYWPTLCKMGLVSIFPLFSPRLAMDMNKGCCQNECWGVLASRAMQTGVLAGPAACFANTGSNTATLIAPALWQRRLTAQTKSSLPPQQYPSVFAGLDRPTCIPLTLSNENVLPTAQLCVVQLTNIYPHLETRRASPGSQYCSACSAKDWHAQWHFNHSRHFSFRLKTISC